MDKIPYDGSIEAEYSDGYIHSETEHDDVSPYTGQHNILNDILEKRPETEHGSLVRFSCFYNNQRFDVDWVGLPTNARPVRFKHMEADTVGGEITAVRLMRVDFGYQYTNEAGRNVQEVREL